MVLKEVFLGSSTLLKILLVSNGFKKSLELSMVVYRFSEKLFNCIAVKTLFIGSEDYIFEYI